MAAARHSVWTFEAYLELEESSNIKHEFFDGAVYAMAGASAAHSKIANNARAALVAQLAKRACSVFDSDMRVKTPSGLATYPDGSVVCGPEHILYQDGETLLNPVLIIEVLSPSTEAYDRGEKFRNYRSIPSLQAYVLIAQDRARIEHFQRQQDESWLQTVAEGTEANLALPSIDGALALADVYAKISFDS